MFEFLLEKMYYFYLVRNRINRRGYVGKTTDSSVAGVPITLNQMEKIVEERFKQHISSARIGDSSVFHRALDEYGPENFELFIIEIGYLTETESRDKEKELMDKFNTLLPFGYNSKE